MALLRLVLVLVPPSGVSAMGQDRGRSDDINKCALQNIHGEKLPLGLKFVYVSFFFIFFFPPLKFQDNIFLPIDSQHFSSSTERMFVRFVSSSSSVGGVPSLEHVSWTVAAAATVVLSFSSS